MEWRDNPILCDTQLEAPSLRNVTEVRKASRRLDCQDEVDRVRGETRALHTLRERWSAKYGWASLTSAQSMPCQEALNRSVGTMPAAHGRIMGLEIEVAVRYQHQ